jgi:acetyl esterase/lipase
MRAFEESPFQDPEIQTNSFLKRLKYFILLYTLKATVSVFLFLYRLPVLSSLLPLPKQPFFATAQPPTLIKYYPCRPTLQTRIFIPNSWKARDAPLPLYIDIHGGGYSITDAQFDDEFAYPFSNKHSICIVSISYSKAPFYRFPTQIHDIAAIVQAVLADSTLPLDKSNVVIGGSSSGGNLVFGVSQELKDVFKGVVAFYPVADYTRTVKQQLASRPVDSGFDILGPTMQMFAWGYIPQGHDKKDPRLSVALARREDLPSKICIVGVELDLMCMDAERMAERLASVGSGNRIGTDIKWEQNGVRWEKVLGHEHGFDQFPAFGTKRFVSRRRAQELRDDVAKWLFREVYGN